MMSSFLEDEEFAKNYKVIVDICDIASDMPSAISAIQSDAKAEKSLFILCDKVYRRKNKYEEKVHSFRDGNN